MCAYTQALPRYWRCGRRRWSSSCILLCHIWIFEGDSIQTLPASKSAELRWVAHFFSPSFLRNNQFDRRLSLGHTVTAAVSATLIHDAISNPAEVIKQRLQMYNSPYKTVAQCARGVFQHEGFRAFYRSYATQLVMNLPHQALHFTTYEFFQNAVKKMWQSVILAIISQTPIGFSQLVAE